MTKRTKLIVIIISIVIALHAVGAVMSGILFSTPNFYRTGFAVCRIMQDGSRVVKLRDGVYLLGNEIKMDKFFEDKGYSEHEEERMGAIHTVEKDGKLYHASVTHSNSFYYVLEIDLRGRSVRTTPDSDAS